MVEEETKSSPVIALGPINSFKKKLIKYLIFYLY